jgi:hypothetical protein
VFETPPYAGVVVDRLLDSICCRYISITTIYIHFRYRHMTTFFTDDAYICRCFKTAKVLYKCKDCEHSRFCSDTCMNAQSRLHLLECKALARYYSQLVQLIITLATHHYSMLIRLKEVDMEGETAPLRLVHNFILIVIIIILIIIIYLMSVGWNTNRYYE